MPSTSQTLVGLFQDYSTARSVAEELISAGFPASDVHVTSGQSNTKAYDAGSSQTIEHEQEHEHEGGISGWFHRVFGGSDVSDDERGGYEQALQSGNNAAVAVDADGDQAQRAMEIMNRYNPVNIDRGNGSGTGYTGGNGSNTGTRRNYTGTNEGEQVIPVVEEQLQVGKRTVQAGGVRVVSRVVSNPVEENLQLRQETVSVNRRPVNRPATEDDFRTGENAIEVRETREEAIVGKQARVVEEVVVGKQATERTETVRDNVRRTEVDVEQIDPAVRSDFQQDYGRRYDTQQTGGSYDAYAPAYEYGYRSANNPLYKGKSWDAAETGLRDEYMRNNPNGSWEKAKDAIRYGWDKVTNKV